MKIIIGIILSMSISIITYSQSTKVYKPKEKNGKWVLINKTDEKCSIAADEILESKLGLFPIKVDNKWGIINSECESLIPCEYDQIKPLSRNEFKAKRGDKYGLVNAENEILLPFSYQDIDSYSSHKNEALVKHNGEWIQIDKSLKKMETERLYFKNPTLPALFAICKEESTLEEDKTCHNDELLEFIYGNLNYPKKARDNNTSGTVVIQFSVSPSGDIIDPKVARDIGDGCGEAALSVVNKMPNWYPAEHDGNSVWTYYTLPVAFKKGVKTARR